MARDERFGIGAKIDTLFLDMLELALAAKYTRREQKRAFLETLSRKLDQLKFFLTLLWETKTLDANKYGQLAGKLTTVGRMLGKWLQSVS